MRIAEIFYSIQGEGMLQGVPSLFIRSSGCNLRCRWCDTPYTSWQPEGRELSIPKILEELQKFPRARHAVITGGEPMLSADLPELTRALKKLGMHITIETAGTLWQELEVDLYSISPKLKNSSPDLDSGWRERHDKLRLAPEVLRKLIYAAEAQLKFVVSSEDDISELRELVHDVLAFEQPWRVLLMPEARSLAELDAKLPWLAQRCKDLGYRLCDRLHIRLYGQQRGT